MTATLADAVPRPVTPPLHGAEHRLVPPLGVWLTLSFGWQWVF